MTSSAFIDVISRIIELLVAKRYDDVVALTVGRRLDSASIRLAISEYGRTLVMPPKDAFDNLDIVQIKDAIHPQWSVRVPLWTQEEGRSDLSVELTIVRSSKGQYGVELDDIHVL